LARNWDDLLPGLPRIDGWTITGGLPDLAELGRMFLDYSEIGEPPTYAWELSAQPS
jgi:hypothetical protein